MNEMLLLPRSISPKQLDGRRAFDVVQGVSSLQARVIRNTIDQGSMAVHKVRSSLVKSYIPIIRVCVFPSLEIVVNGCLNLVGFSLSFLNCKFDILCTVAPLNFV